LQKSQALVPTIFNRMTRWMPRGDVLSPLPQ
jgi:hypothetical protein